MTSGKNVDDKMPAEAGHTNKCVRWLSNVTVEPVMFFYMFAFMLTSVVEQAFFVDKACRVNLQLPDSICSNIDSDTSDNKTRVQIIVSDFHQYDNIASHAVPLVLALFLGSWSDRRGRKLPLLLGLFGKLIYSLMVIVNSLQDTWPLETVVWTASLPSALTGGDLAIFMACFSYIADITTSENRTFRVSVVDFVYLVTMPTGVALGKYLFASVTGRSFAIMFSLNALMLATAFLYTLFRLDWRTAPRQQSLYGSGTNCCVDFFDKDHVIQSVKAVVRKRPDNRRMYLIMLFIAMTFYTFQRDEKPMSYLYTQKMFNWGPDKFSDYRTFQSSSYVIGVLVGVPLMNKLLGLRDTTMVMVGAVAHAAARVVFALAEVPWLFYVGGGIVSFGPIAAPVLRSMTSKVVPVSERGKVLAILAAADNAVPLFSGALYTQVYNATVKTAPATIFWVTVGSQVLVFLLSLCIHLSLGERKLDAEENTLITDRSESDKSDSQTDDPPISDNDNNVPP